MSNPLPRESYLSWLEIDTEAVRHNYQVIRNHLAGKAAYFGVVKADSYGHGAVVVAQELERLGVDMLCVARMEEAKELRDSGLRSPMLVFAPPFAPQARESLSLDCRMTFCTRDHVDAISAAAQESGRQAIVHLKVDTGMRRLGAQPEECLELVRYALSKPGISVEGVMTHFACSDEPDKPATDEQVREFEGVRRALNVAGIQIRYYHACNSAGFINYPDAWYDAIRTGVLNYGLFPSGAMVNSLPVKPVMSMKTRIVLLKEVPAGTGVSYGHTFVTQRPTRLATIPLGYADGYPRHASSKGRMIVRGKEAPILGRVCMDLILLDVTDIPDVEVGDEVLAFGRSGEVTLYAEHVAESFGSISYELCTRVGKRLPRFIPN